MNAISRLRALFLRSSVERELKSELEFHLEMETRAHVRSGLPASEARATAMHRLDRKSVV